MKKTWLLVFTLSLCTLALVWCNSKCNCSKGNENESLDRATQVCIDKGWTHSLVHSQTAVYGECSFPSWVTCEDRTLAEWECYYEADISGINTEEKRLIGCQQNISDWIRDVEGWELNYITYEDESETWASLIRNFVISYSKDGNNWKMNAECVSDFVDWSLFVSYDEATIEDISIDENVNNIVENQSEESFEETAE